MSTPHSIRAIAKWDGRSFDKRVQRGIALVDFSERWCGPCHMQLPILERVAAEVGRRATVALVDVDEAPALAEGKITGRLEAGDCRL
jgi:thioredoxin-like negative regulator of GroEL